MSYEDILHEQLDYLLIADDEGAVERRKDVFALLCETWAYKHGVTDEHELLDYVIEHANSDHDRYEDVAMILMETFDSGHSPRWAEEWKCRFSLRARGVGA
jgi:hypothetical protein